MPLPATFHHSQSTLQDYVDCRRRFHLRYVRRLAWPSIEAEPVLENERRMRLGSQFHRMVQRCLVGVPDHRLDASIHSAELAAWWENFQHFRQNLAVVGGLENDQLTINRGVVYPEVSLAAPLCGHNLVAKCDLVVFAPGSRVLLYDWKTSHLRTHRERLATRLQTRVYPYLLVRAGAYLNHGKPIDPDTIEMVYWFSDHPDQPERFCYNARQCAEDERYLSELVAEIDRLRDEDFYLTPTRSRSDFCVYRSLCDRGITAGQQEDFEEAGAEEKEGNIDFNFDQIAEVIY